MAAKAKAPVKAAKKPVAKTQTKVKAKPKGLVLSAAQWKAYNKAYNATAAAASRRFALAKAAQRFRAYRLGAAYATIKRANVATHNAQTAAIAAFAAKMSYQQSKLAHQNQALRTRVELDAFNHANLAGRLQFVQGGVKGYAHAAVMRTVDQSQAMSYEAKVFAAARRAAKAGAKSTVKSKKKYPAVSAAINAQASAAGLKAAKATKRGPTAKAKKQPTPKATVKKGSGGKSAKAPVVKAKSRTAPYQGVHRGPVVDGNGHWILGLNDFEGTCIMTAVANALRHQTGWWLPDEDIAYWTGRAGPHPTISGVLQMLWVLQPWPEVRLHQPIPLVASYEYFCKRVIGYDDHAAYAFDDKMVSYAEVWPVVEADEVCTIEFTAV